MDDSTNLGYYYCFNCNDAGKHKENPNQATCDICGSTDCVNFPHGFTLNWSEIDTLSRISTDKAFILSMDDLKKHDVIEFNVKMAQFKTQTNSTTNPNPTNPVVPNAVLRQSPQVLGE